MPQICDPASLLRRLAGAPAIATALPTACAPAKKQLTGVDKCWMDIEGRIVVAVDSTVQRWLSLLSRPTQHIGEGRRRGRVERRWRGA